jgi:hypothetical protein
MNTKESHRKSVMAGLCGESSTIDVESRYTISFGRISVSDKDGTPKAYEVRSGR